MTRFAVLALAALTLSGCGAVQAMRVYDAAAEPNVDDAVSFGIERACNLPLDWQARQIRARGRDYLMGLTLICEDWAMIRQMLTAPPPVVP